MARVQVEKTYENVIQQLASEFRYLWNGDEDAAVYLETYDFTQNRSVWDAHKWGGYVPVEMIAVWDKMTYIERLTAFYFAAVQDNRADADAYRYFED